MNVRLWVMIALCPLVSVAKALPDPQSAIEAGRAHVGQDYLETITQQRSAMSPSVSKKKNTGRHYQVLMSESMKDSDRRALMQWAATRDDVTLVIAGLLDSEHTITDAQRRIARWTQEAKAIPNIVLDPRPFDELGIESVPVLIALDGETRLARVSGVTDPDWLEQKLAGGQSGDVGQYGSLTTVSETSLTTIMKTRAANLDMAALIEQAKANVGRKLATYPLPNTDRTQTRTFTPLITANETVFSPTGEVIRAAGESVNLLTVLPFHQTLIVIDARDDKQVAFAKAQEKTGRLKILLTGVPMGLDAIKQLEQSLGEPVYLLTRGIAKGFDLQSVPSLVQADNQNKKFVIKEVAL